MCYAVCNQHVCAMLGAVSMGGLLEWVHYCECRHECRHMCAILDAVSSWLGCAMLGAVSMGVLCWVQSLAVGC